MLISRWVIAVTLSLIFQGGIAWSEEKPINQDAESDRNQTSQDQAAHLGFPIRILEEPEQSESAIREQQEASQREIDDLQAQNLAAESAQGAFRVGVAQTVLAFFGTLALIYSLYLNRKATHAAQDAVAVTRDIGQRQIRAYLAVENVSVVVTSPFIKIAWEITNIGHSPAQNVKALGAWAGEIGEFSNTWLDEIIETPLGSIAPSGRVQNIRRTNESTLPDVSLSVDQIQEIAANKRGFWVYGRIKYSDIFGGLAETRFRYRLIWQHGAWGMQVCEDGNDMT